MPEAATAEEWLQLNSRFRIDASELRESGRGHGALYLAGYAAETALKALLHNLHGTVANVHSLNDLVARARMPLSGLTPPELSFAQVRDVAFRYELDLPTDWEEQYDAALKISSRVLSELGRRRKQRRR